MGFTCGLVGLPNVGKSTLFNALTRSAQADVANYPFCTIDPNTAEVPVPDPRVDQIARAARSAKAESARLGFVDIAGLVRGASKGEGLGNRFLGHIREVDAIAHVLRCFDDPDIAHVHGEPDPASDWETVNTELLLADLERAERLLKSLARRLRGGDKNAAREARLLEQALTLLGEGRPARIATIVEANRAAWRQLALLTAKPVLIVANSDGLEPDQDAALLPKIESLAAAEGARWIRISAAVEAEIVQMEAEEGAAFMAELGIVEPSLGRLVREGYSLLGLITFFTAGVKEARAWTLTRGSTAQHAAGRIHTDFARGFIRAETVNWEEFVSLGGESEVREAGRMRSEGRTYVVEEGDVIRFRFNV